jgi:hypothetical protein
MIFAARLALFSEGNQHHGEHYAFEGSYSSVWRHAQAWEKARAVRRRTLMFR